MRTARGTDGMSQASTTDILMYHSIARGRGPLVIDPDTFRRQLDSIAERGLRGISLRDFVTALDTRGRVERAIVLTFDDGYCDFADIVIPELESRGWSGTVFLSTNLVGSLWNPDDSGVRSLLGWDAARAAVARGIEIGSHAVTHTDLTRLPHEEAIREIEISKSILEQEAGTSIVSFAAPFGRLTPALQARLVEHYHCAVGTRMAAAPWTGDRFQWPRIDMWYFRNISRWEAYLDGARTYFTVRQALRRVRHGVLASV